MNEIYPEGNPKYFLTPDEIDEIHSHNLFEKIDPALKVHFYKKMEIDFRNILESKAFEKILYEQSNPKFSDLSDNQINHQSWIHEDKISTGIIGYLSKKELAKPDLKKDRGLNYYIVDNSVAHLYISLLAQNIAKSKQNMIPASEQLYHWENVSNPNYLSRKEACINLILNEGILSPTPETSIESIIKFRDDNYSQCQKYQNNLFKIVKNASKNYDDENFSEIMKDEIKEIKIELNDLKENIKDLEINCNYNTAYISIPLIGKMFAGTIEAIATGSSQNLNLYDIVEGFSLIFAGYCYFRKQHHQITSGSPLTYLYLAEKRGIYNTI